MEYVLQTYGLSKRYGNQMSVDQANLNIEKGEIYGFVGENGSGKTTIIRMITGLIAPTDGSFQLFGVDNKDPKIHQARRKMGAVVESPAIYPNMTAKENLQMQASILRVRDAKMVRKTLEMVGLGDLYDEKKLAGNFSLGMRQRLGIAMALMGEPKFLILDEPMNGLDPVGIVELRELILELNRKGITFLISSHILTELSLVATKYGIISKGRVLQEITAQQLHESCGRHILLRAQNPQALAALCRKLLPDRCVVLEEGTVKLSGDVDLNGLMKAVLESENPLESVNCRDTGIEEYYLSVIGGCKHG